MYFSFYKALYNSHSKKNHVQNVFFLDHCTTVYNKSIYLVRFIEAQVFVQSFRVIHFAIHLHALDVLEFVLDLSRNSLLSFLSTAATRVARATRVQCAVCVTATGTSTAAGTSKANSIFTSLRYIFGGIVSKNLIKMFLFFGRNSVF